jgi:hypothetical protein
MMLLYYEEPPVTAALTPDISRLYLNFSYWSERLDGKHTIQAPFDFDWDSVKRWKTVFYWWLKGRAKVAALIHDDLYVHGRFAGKEITRLQADQVFFDAMAEEMRKHREYLGLTGKRLKHREFADMVRRNAIYIGVRIGGYDAWNDYRAAEMSA